MWYMNWQYRENLTKLENMKNGQIHKTFLKKVWNLVVSKPEYHNLRRNTAIETKFGFSRLKEHYLIADTKLQVDQIKEKNGGKVQ